MPRSSIFTSTSSTSAASGAASSRVGRGSCGAPSNQKYGSVKYNRVASAPKEDVHETFSNPVMPVSAPFVVEVDGVAEEEREKTDLNGSWKQMDANKHNGSATAEPAMTPANHFMSTLEAPTTVTVPTTRQKHLSLLPPSLHISFDVEPENNRSQQFAMNMPLSQSSDNVRNYRYGSVSSTCGQSTPPRRGGVYRPGNRRNFLQQSEIAQISAGYMRATGAVQQFRVCQIRR